MDMDVDRVTGVHAVYPPWIDRALGPLNNPGILLSHNTK